MLMLKLIRKLLLRIVDDIDAGNSNISEEEQTELLEYLNRITENRLSKYEACRYLNISRATFDNLVRDGKLPRGTKKPGFKELSWSKIDLDKYVAKSKTR